MATENDFGKCKCCLKETYLKNMWYTAQAKGEVFGQMLVDCFAIDWMIQGNIEDDKICEACISKLRVAVAFKNQVMKSQAAILNKGKVKEVEEVAKEKIKEESIEEEEESIEKEEEESIEEEESLNLNGDQKVYEDVEFLEEEVLDAETNDDGSQDYEPEEKKPKWPRKLPPSERYKQYRKYTEDDLKNAVEAVRTKEMTTVKASEVYNIPRKTISKKLYDNTDGDTRKQEEELDTLLQKHKDNMRAILVASNATPIKGHWGFGYACLFCPKQFAEPSQLKQHTFTHGSLIPSIKIKSLTEHILKLDVTDLKCNICDVDIDALDDLMLHLKEKHRMLLHLDLQSHIVPFSFANGILKCVKCPRNFISFKNLSEHMYDAHFRNYVCVVCNRGFVNVRSLKTHSIAHGINVFACTFCTKVFISKTEMLDHEKEHSTKTRERTFSDENTTSEGTFYDENVTTSTISDEKIDTVTTIAREIVHTLDHICKVCPKMFSRRSDLLYHINSSHKRYKCGICDKTFNYQFQLKQHVLRKHVTKTNSYRCPKCAKEYVSKHLLKEHMLEHAGREYCCEVCCRSFSEEDNYMAHMKSNHGLE